MKKIINGIALTLIILLAIPFLLFGSFLSLLYFPIDRIRYNHSQLSRKGVKYRFGISLSTTFQVIRILRNLSFTLVSSAIVGQHLVSFLVNETRYILLCFDLSRREEQFRISPETQEWVFEHYDDNTNKTVATPLFDEMKRYVDEQMLATESDIQYFIYLTKGSESELFEDSKLPEDHRFIGSKDLKQRLTQKY